ncbi:MAG TPA: hypothetical protein VNI52_08435 [Sphingobacteriaceae bacterium]|nr:hypothetical protein [Sphingobacteriaceae bacterium]
MVLNCFYNLVQPFRGLIHNDTIVGFYRNRDAEEGNPRFYYIQSLNNLQYKKNIDYEFIPSYIDAYRNGCLYFGVFGGSIVYKLCADKSLTKQFTKYNDTLFYANKVMLYHDKTVVTSMNGVYIFDKQEKLVLKHKYLEEILANGASSIVGNKLIFTEVEQLLNPKDSTYKATSWVHCVNLDAMKLIWSRKFANTYTSSSGDPSNGEQFSLKNNINTGANGDKIPRREEIAIPTHDSNYLLNLKDGAIIWDSEKAMKGLKFYAFKFEGNLCYGSNTNSIFCIDTKTNRVLWQVKRLL